MDTSAPSKFSSSSTPEPHYIPGYEGYCPQLKYQFGRSYGQLTSELLSSPEVNHSSRLVLSGVSCANEAASSGIGRNIPDSHIIKKIPGYTGFIPRRQSYFACSYGEMCRKAFTDLYLEQQKKYTQKSANLPLISEITGHTFENHRPSPPMTAVNSVFNYKPSVPFIPIGRPLSMDDNNPHKYYMSGFTGHVPKARFLIGNGYPISTNKALIQFGKQLHSEPRFVQRVENLQNSTGPTPHHSNTPVLPAFTGHIPGYRYMYGQTFGHLTQKALEKRSNKRVAWTKS